MELKFFLGQMQPMRMLQSYVASTVLVLKVLTNFTEGTNSTRLTRTISVDRCVEIRSVPVPKSKDWSAGVP